MLAPAMLSLRKTPHGVEYYELNRSQPCPLQEINREAFADPEDESDAKKFSVLGFERCSVKRLKKQPEPSQSNVRWSQQEVQSRR